MSSVRDPVALTFLTITHLSSNDRAWSAPSVELTATSPAESSSSTLSLPVEDLGAREEDVTWGPSRLGRMAIARWYLWEWSRSTIAFIASCLI